MDNLPREPDLTDNDTRREMWDTYSPIALFASAQDFITKRNNLVPVAIQMDFTPGLVYLSDWSNLVSIHTVIQLYTSSSNSRILIGSRL